jgi:hypothetical protein
MAKGGGGRGSGHGGGRGGGGHGSPARLDDSEDVMNHLLRRFRTSAETRKRKKLAESRRKP